MRPATILKRAAAFLALLVVGLLIVLYGTGRSPAEQAQTAPAQSQISWGQQTCDRADRLLADGKPAEALKLYQEVLKVLPASPRARRGVSACQAAIAASSRRQAAPTAGRQAPAGSARALTIRGTCNWGGTESTWSATLTARGSDTYDAVYVSRWSGQTLNYVGRIVTDRRTQIRGNGRASGGGANGTFEFSGTYGANGIARCSYREIGGSRTGTLTAELPR